MRYLMITGALGALLAASSVASAQMGGGSGGMGGGMGGTGDAAAQNLPSTVGVGNHSGNGYYGGPGGGERPYFGAPYQGRSVIRGPVPPGYPSYPY